MNGLAGVGLALLRRAMPAAIPSLLLVEPPRPGGGSDAIRTPTRRVPGSLDS
jgi:hypothetical protein